MKDISRLIEINNTDMNKVSVLKHTRTYKRLDNLKFLKL